MLGNLGGGGLLGLGGGQSTAGVDEILKNYAAAIGETPGTAFKGGVFKLNTMKTDLTKDTNYLNHKMQAGEVFNKYDQGNPNPREYYTFVIIGVRNAHNFLKQQKQDFEVSKKNMDTLSSKLSKCKDNMKVNIAQKIKEIKERNSRLLEKTMAVESLIERYSLLTNHFERVTNNENHALKTISEADAVVKICDEKLEHSRSNLENALFSDFNDSKIEQDFSSCDPQGQKTIFSILSKFRHGIEHLEFSIKKSKEIVNSYIEQNGKN